MSRTEMPNNYAIVFPGQGSQSIGMLGNWQEHSELVDSILEEANSALNYDLRLLIAGGPEDKLNQTSVTQPAMLTAGVAAWRIWQLHREANSLPKPKYYAGHSLGEYTALVAAGVLDFSDALRLVEYRGRCMQEAVASDAGAMAAILGLDDEQVVEICDLAAAEGIVEAVNFNAPGQVVIAGETQAVETAIELLKQAGARRAILLPVSVPSHCQLMISAAHKLDQYFDSVNFARPEVPVIHNVDARSHNDIQSIRRVLVEQLHKPVLWVDCMQTLVKDDVKTIIECGPGKVLTGLQRRIDRSINAKPVFDEESLHKALEPMLCPGKD
jgi:[acyl-carrier-protein] S-malonyltransferase